MSEELLEVELVGGFTSSFTRYELRQLAARLLTHNRFVVKVPAVPPRNRRVRDRSQGISLLVLPSRKGQ